MFGEGPHLDPLESRKQLLIVESELNRAQLSREWQSMEQEVGNLAHRAKTFGAWISLVGLLGAGVAALRRGPSVPGASEHSWLKKFLNGARMASTLWFAYRGWSDKRERP